MHLTDEERQALRTYLYRHRKHIALWYAASNRYFELRYVMISHTAWMIILTLLWIAGADFWIALATCFAFAALTLWCIRYWIANVDTGTVLDCSLTIIEKDLRERELSNLQQETINRLLARLTDENHGHATFRETVRAYLKLSPAFHDEKPPQIIVCLCSLFHDALQK